MVFSWDLCLIDIVMYCYCFLNQKQRKTPFVTLFIGRDCNRIWNRLNISYQSWSLMIHTLRWVDESVTRQLDTGRCPLFSRFIVEGGRISIIRTMSSLRAKSKLPPHYHRVGKSIIELIAILAPIPKDNNIWLSYCY